MSSSDPTPQQPPQAHSHGQPQQPQPQQQYAPPTQGVPPQGSQAYAQQQWAPQPARPAATGRLNVLGVVALAILALFALLSFVLPLLYREAALSGSYTFISVGLPLTQGVLVLAAIGLAIGGVLQRSAPRMRWTAVGALVSGALSLVSMTGSMVGGWIASALPYGY